MRKYTRCFKCGKTIDTTNKDTGFCKQCFETENNRMKKLERQE